MFFDDLNIGARKKDTALRQPPPVPNTGWVPPRELPNLSNAVMISIDTETKDPALSTEGPGWARGKGHIVGVSLGAIDKFNNVGTWYFPLRHEFQPEDNLDPKVIIPWLKTQLETPHIPKVFANASYDIGWLTEENIYVKGEINDVQFAETLLNDDFKVNLEFLGNKYVGKGKDSSAMYRWLAETYGGNINSDQRKNIFRCPPKLVGYYAESDALLPLLILQKQYTKLAEEDLLDVYRMECDSIIMLVRMRMAGVTIDLKKAEQLYAELAIDIQIATKNLSDTIGFPVNVNSGQDLKKMFDKLGLEYPSTAAGNPSFQKEFLNTVENPLIKFVLEIREMEKIRSTFIRSYILESNVNGKIYCQFHPMKNESSGTKTGRFASSTPKLQNIPVRSKLGKRVRKLFIPDEGHVAWRKSDYSQIEYRMLAHYASGPGSNELRETYNNDPKTDYHTVVQNNVKKITGIEIDRKPIKNINFGLLYGQSERGLAYKAGFTEAQAKDVFKAYHQGATYVKPTMDAIAQEVHEFGYIKTVMGRRTRFNLWEKKGFGERSTPIPYDQALSRYGSNIIRSNAFRGVNYKLQGSAADVIKKAMLACFTNGVFEVTGMPKLQVHDELDFSVKSYSKEQKEAYNEMEYLLENALKLNIPVKVETGEGPNWGEIE
jgi:DNA polymerase-1